MDNPKTLVTLDIQDTERRHTNKRAYKTQNEDKQTGIKTQNEDKQTGIKTQNEDKQTKNTDQIL
jgi:hypothetical protein